MSSGIVLLTSDAVVRSQARRLRMDVKIADDWPQPYTQTLYIGPGTRVPWDLVQTGLRLVERWDAAAPLWTLGVLAGNLGTPEERRRTEKVIHDLRVPVYAPELLFVADSEAGRALVAAWRAECTNGDERLAFLRALYSVKPRFCALPRTWLVDATQREMQESMSRRRQADVPGQGRALVTVEISPGRLVKCYAGDEGRVREQLAQRARGGRHG